MNSLHVLHLEDDHADAELIRETITVLCPDWLVSWVSKRAEFEAALKKGGFDVILCDYKLPEWDGMSALALAREKLSDMPLIFVSGAIGDEAAIEALKHGATDYVLKDRLSRLIPCIRRAVQESRERIARQKAEHDLQKTLGELQAFAYVASHDLHEPLRKITAFGDRIKTRIGAALDEQSRDYFHRMEGATARMAELIEGLLSFSRITTQGKAFTSVNLNQIVRETIGELATQIERQRGKVEIEPLPTVEADAIQMRQLFQNLINNALKYQRADTPPLVRIIAQPSHSDCVEIWVEDNGIGFDEKYVDRIFEPFQRLHGREYEGTGMGLTICRKIIERHNGHIAARSTLGRGSTFIVTLPVT